MKKSDYINELSQSINSMFDEVGDKTPLGSMFGAKQTTQGRFSVNDFVDFLKSPFLVKFKGMWRKVSNTKGKDIDLESFYTEAGNELLLYFKTKKFTKDKLFEDCFTAKNIHGDGYFDDLAMVITNVLEKYGKPPKFHKSRDKVLKYDWDSE
jgi:hypothetical protein